MPRSIIFAEEEMKELPTATGPDLSKRKESAALTNSSG
jgi:hypothetical protein